MIMVSNFFTKRIVNIMITLMLFFTCYLILAGRSLIDESNHLLAVTWCKKDKNGVLYDESISRFGIYVIMEKTADEYSVRIRAMDYPIGNIFQPYRYAYSSVIARVPDVAAARKKWSNITCLPDNSARVGESGYVYKWSDS